MRGILYKGIKGKAVVILIHGMGVNSEFFTNTHDTTILSGTVALKYLITKEYGENSEEISADYKTTLWDSLKEEGYNLFTWSQRYPLGSMIEAVKELEEIILTAKRLFPDSPIALVGHSRGGLIARKYMEDTIAPIKALITIATPHQGSSIAKIGMYMSNIVQTTEKMFSTHTLAAIHKIVKGINNLLNSSGIEELYRDSYFLQNLHDKPSDAVHYLSVGGTEPDFFPFPLWSHMSSLLPFVNSFSSGFIPEEIIHGKGDGLVSEESSKMLWSSEHYALPENHFSIICHSKTIKAISGILKNL